MNYLMSCTGSDGAEFPHADVDLQLGLDGRNKLGIGACKILAVTTNIRAQDFADNKPASFENDQKREYHPVFPTALPADANIDSYLALNYASLRARQTASLAEKTHSNT